MTNKRIEDLTAVAGMDGTEQFVLVDTDGNSRKIDLATLKAFINTDPTIVPSSEPWKGARVNRSSSLTGVTFPFTVPWNNEVEDTDGFWTVAAPTRFTVPTGVTRVRLTASIAFESDSGTAGSVFTSLLKNGVSMEGGSLFVVRQPSAVGFSNNMGIVFSWDDPCVAGDYYEVRTNKSGLTAVDEILTSERTWFQIAVVEHTL